MHALRILLYEQACPTIFPAKRPEFQETYDFIWFASPQRTTEHETTVMSSTYKYPCSTFQIARC